MVHLRVRGPICAGKTNGPRGVSAMKLDLSEVRDSLYFWPAVTLSGIAVFFFGWAALILEQNWIGQAIWGALAALTAMVLLITAIRASHRAVTQRRRLAAPTIRL